jgi:hypothetical protein
MPIAQPYGRQLSLTKTRKPTRATRKMASAGRSTATAGKKPELTGRALALTRGKGKKIGLKRLASAPTQSKVQTSPEMKPNTAMVSGPYGNESIRVGPLTGSRTRRFPDTSPLDRGPVYTPPPGEVAPYIPIGGLPRPKRLPSSGAVGPRAYPAKR